MCLDWEGGGGFFLWGVGEVHGVFSLQSKLVPYCFTTFSEDVGAAMSMP